MINVGAAIKNYRNIRGMTQTQLADRLCMSKQAICNYESGRREPDYITLEAISRVLDVPMSKLIEHDVKIEAFKRPEVRILSPRPQKA